jgi:hypothetical protein
MHCWPSMTPQPSIGASTRGERRLETGRAPPQALSRRTAGSTQAQINVCVVIGGPRPRQDTLITLDRPG